MLGKSLAQTDSERITSCEVAERVRSLCSASGVGSLQSSQGGHSTRASVVGNTVALQYFLGIDSRTPPDTRILGYLRPYIKWSCIICI